MTIDEAIKHAEEVVEDHEKIKRIKAVTLEECKCAEEHRQLAGWLRDYKRFLAQESCNDCIRRSDIGLTDFEMVMCNGDYKEALKMLLDIIKKAPPVMPQPKTGHWITQWNVAHQKEYYYCSECGEEFSYDGETGIKMNDYDFCPNCGAKMVEP